MYRTIFDKTTGNIITCQKLNQVSLQAKLAENSNWDYIDVYTKGATNIAVDTVTKKLKKIAPPIPSKEDIAVEVRSHRRILLLNCDWTQGADSPLNDAIKAEWAAYRQALRDMPDNLDNVNSFADVVWPTPPQ